MIDSELDSGLLYGCWFVWWFVGFLVYYGGIVVGVDEYCVDVVVYYGIVDWYFEWYFDCCWGVSCL